MILYKKNFNINPVLLTNIVFAFFPISFIFGNLITNINTLLFCCLGILHLRSRILTTKFNLSIKIIFLLFLIIFFSTSLNFIKSLYIDGYEYSELIRLLKSISFFRYFLMLIIVYLLSESDILNFKYFFVSAAFSSVFISLDIIFQYIFGFNIIGLKSFHLTLDIPDSYLFRNAGFFGDELIAGGFIKNFSFFSIFFVAFIFKNKNNIRFLLIMLTICIVGMGILFSGNRMPLILFVFGLLLIFLLNNKLKKVLSVSLIVLFIIFGLLGSFDKNIKDNLYYFYRVSAYTIINLPNTAESKKFDFILQSSGMVKYDTSKEDGLLRHDFDSYWPATSDQYGHAKLFDTAIDIWQKNKIFGSGIKSFRVKCAKIAERIKNRMCSNHPHNYYLEILTDTGIAGFLLVCTIALIFVVFIIKNFKFFSGNRMGNYILLATVISLILETFPLKSTGSIFTTNDATYLILISSIILSYKKLLAVQN